MHLGFDDTTLVELFAQDMSDASKSYVIASFFFTGLGMAIQMCNVGYATLHALKRPTSYNVILVLCLITFATSFIPLFFTAVLVANDNADQSAKPKFLKTFTLLYGLSTLFYMLMVQWRFRVIKVIIRYPDVLDVIFVGLTITFWLVLILILGVILPIPSRIQGLATAAWTVWALIVDNTLSIAFISTIYKSRTRLGTVKGEVRRLWIIVVTALCAVCTIAWCALIMLVISNFMPQSDQWKMMIFRIGYCLSTLQWSGALVFIYQAPALVDSRGGATAVASRCENSIDAHGNPTRKPSVRGNRNSVQLENGTCKGTVSRSPSTLGTIKASKTVEGSDDSVFDGRKHLSFSPPKPNHSEMKAVEFAKAPVVLQDVWRDDHIQPRLSTRSHGNESKTFIPLKTGDEDKNTSFRGKHNLEKGGAPSLPFLSFISMGSTQSFHNAPVSLRKSLTMLKSELDQADNKQYADQGIRHSTPSLRSSKHNLDSELPSKR